MPDLVGAKQLGPVISIWHAKWLTLLLLLSLGLHLAFMTISVAQAPVTSDEAMIVLQAKAIARGARPLLFPDQPYLFPLGSYLTAPVANLLPRNALGARHLCFAFGLASWLAQIFLIRKLVPWGGNWAALVLALFSSSYMLTIQAGYAPPHYEILLFFWGLVIWLALLQRSGRGWRGSWLAGATGLASGLSFSAHPLSLSLLIPVGLFVCLDRNWRGALRKIPAYLAGLVPGLLPFLVVDFLLHPGASISVTSHRSLMSVVNLGAAEAIGHALSGALGLFACAFPDIGEEIHYWSPLETALLWLFLLVLTAATGLSLKDLAVRTWQRRWLSLEPFDFFPWACWLGLGMFALNERANAAQFRYLLVAPFCLPFMVLFLCTRLRNWTGKVLGLAVAGLALFNLLAGISLVARWSQPGYVTRQSLSADLTPAIRVLDGEGIRFCYAAHWTASRLTFLTDERIIASQPFNERFREWTVANKPLVDHAKRVAYVLTAPDSFDAVSFERVLQSEGVEARSVKAGAYKVYVDFRWKPGLDGERVPPGELTVTASHHSDQAAGLARGGGWNSGQFQETGMWVEIALERPRPINGLLVRYPSMNTDYLPRAYRVRVRRDGVWREVLPKVAGSLDDFEMINRHPVWERPVQNLRFQPVLADALRLEVAQKGDPLPWSLAGLEVFYQAEPDLARGAR